MMDDALIALARELGPAAVERNPQLFEELSADERKLALPHVVGEPTKADIKAEKDLQKYAEQLLAQRGYHRLTADNAVMLLERDVPCAGFFGHWVNSKRNPLMPDLLVIDREANRRPLLVELKNGSERIKWEPGQAEMCAMNCWTLCTSYEEFDTALKAWENEGQPVTEVTP